ncbi:MAG: AAA family ATPase [Paludibacteraceae bacterium]|nr:AAA family ATPase [Paludibacteraceae bacterium]
MIDFTDIEELEFSYHNRLASTPTTFNRYMLSHICWDDRLIGIKGAKGIGKTTMILQHIKKSYNKIDDVLYVSMDNLWFAKHDLKDLVRFFYQHGGRYLFIDEIHYYKPWQQVLKNIYDDYVDLHIVYSGSSLLQIEKGEADLSRRLATYNMAGMSFREYLDYENVVKLNPISLDTLINNHVEVAMDIKQKVNNILPHFEKYINNGYYPFYKEVHKNFQQRLQQVVNHVLTVDYPAIDEVEINTIRKAKKMLMVLSESVPQTPNMNELYAQLETSRSQGIKMMWALERAGLLSLLSTSTKKLKTLYKPDKILLDNPNLMYALGNNTDIGTIRETFFMNQLKQIATVTYPPKGDFLVDDRYLFEVGGASKTFNQIKDIENSYLAVDGTEIGHGNRIPLWMFGLLY